MMARKVENKDVNDSVTKTNPVISDLSENPKYLKDNYHDNDKKNHSDHSERNSAVDKVNQINMITKENVDKEKNDAWRNLKYMRIQKTIKHKLPLMLPPDRVSNKSAQKYKQIKEVFDIDTQTDPVSFSNAEDCELIQFIKDNCITREAIESLLNDDNDLNNNIENQSDVEQETTSQPDITPVKVDEKFHHLIDKYSQENKIRLNNLIDSLNKKYSNPFKETSSNKNYFFEFIHNSLWQIVICMSNYKAIIETEHEKVKSYVDKGTQTESEIVKSKKDGNDSAQAAHMKEITMSQLSSHLPNVTDYDILKQKMQVNHGNYQNLPFPQTSQALHPNNPRTLCQHNQQAQNEPQKQLIKKPRLHSPQRHKEVLVNSSSNAMKTNTFSSSQWQFQGTRPGHQWRHCLSNMARPQWFNVMPPPMMPPPPPPPPPRYNQEPRFTKQRPSMGQYQSSQRQDITEYQKYQQMEMQKKAWESQLQNYPNSAWSQQLHYN